MYLTSCSNCDWTLTDAESIRIYVNGNEFPPFQLESDGSFNDSQLKQLGTVELRCAECGHGLAQDTSLSREKVVTSDEIEAVLAGLSSLQQKLIRNAWGEDANVSEFDLSEDELQLAMDMITNLSREKVVTSDEVTEMVTPLLLASSDADRSGGFVELSPVEAKEIAAKLTNLSREKVVTGSIEGGVLSLGEVPKGVAVDIRDYDVEGVDEELVEEDENGDKYFPVC